MYVSLAMVKRPQNQIQGSGQIESVYKLKVKAHTGKEIRENLVQIGIFVICRQKLHVAVSAEPVDGSRHHQTARKSRGERRHDFLMPISNIYLKRNGTLENSQ